MYCRPIIIMSVKLHYWNYLGDHRPHILSARANMQAPGTGAWTYKTCGLKTLEKKNTFTPSRTLSIPQPSGYTNRKV